MTHLTPSQIDPTPSPWSKPSRSRLRRLAGRWSRRPDRRRCRSTWAGRSCDRGPPARLRHCPTSARPNARGQVLPFCYQIGPLSGYDALRTKPAGWRRASLDRVAASCRADSSAGARAIASALAAKALNASSDWAIHADQPYTATPQSRNRCTHASYPAQRRCPKQRLSLTFPGARPAQNEWACAACGCWHFGGGSVQQGLSCTGYVEALA